MSYKIKYAKCFYEPLNNEINAYANIFKLTDFTKFSSNQTKVECGFSLSLNYSILGVDHIFFYLDENFTVTSCSCKFCRANFKCKHCVSAFHYVENLLNSDPDWAEEVTNKFKNARAQAEENVIQLVRKTEIEKEKKISQSLLSKIENLEIIPLSNKIRIDMMISYFGTGLTARFKVGNEKMYIINSFNKFFDAFNSNEYYEYTKKFGFVHSATNFDDHSLEIIKYLHKFSFDNSSKFLYLNNSTLEEIINLYKGKFINVFDNDVYVSLEPKKIVLEYTENNILKLAEEVTILKGFLNDFVLSKKTLYTASYINQTFRSLVANFFPMKFEYNSDVFRNDIYPRFSESIIVPEKLKSELKLEEFKIRSYFDLQDGILTVENKYLINDVEVSDENRLEKNFNAKLHKNYLNNLGFVDNKIIDFGKISNFFKTNLSDFTKICEVYLSENVKNFKIKAYSKFQTRVTYNLNMLSICFEDSQFSDDELQKIIKSLRKKNRFVKLNKDTIIEIDEETSEKLLNTIDEFDLDIANLTKPQEIPLYQSLKLKDEDINIVDFSIDDNISSLIDDIKNYKSLEIDIPKHLNGVLRDYQIDAYKWMKTLCKYNFSGILADDMGLGKTLEIISVITSDNTDKPSIIICPKSLCYNWKNEFSIWASDIDVINIIGNPNERKRIIDRIEKNKNICYIISYDSLRNDIKSFLDIEFSFCILDEAQSIKNKDTLKSQSVKLIKSDHRFVLTGTPIENSILDLWSLFDFLMPKYLGDYSGFKKYFEKSITIMNNEEVAAKLVKKIAPFVLRRTKEEVLNDLPKKIETIQMASMEREQRKYYDAQLKKTKDIILNDPKNKILILSSLTRLRQLCVDPDLFIENYTGKSAKIDLLIEIVESYIYDGHKIIIFSQFTSAFDKISSIFNSLNFRHFCLTGKTSAIDRMEMSNKFNDVTSPEKIMLISLKAGGTGLNLIGADIVIHLDPWWNYAVENQATDRAHRIGQTKSVNVIKLITENSIEQKVIELQKIKLDIANRIISSDETNIDKVEIDDIKFLLDV